MLTSLKNIKAHPFLNYRLHSVLIFCDDEVRAAEAEELNLSKRKTHQHHISQQFNRNSRHSF